MTRRRYRIRDRQLSVHVSYTTSGAHRDMYMTRALAMRTVRTLESLHAIATTAGDVAECWELEQQLDAYRAALHRAGVCSSCGRMLEDPQSIERGLGPDCYRKQQPTRRNEA